MSRIGVSAYKERGKYILQVNCLPGRPRRSFTRKDTRDDALADVRRAIERGHMDEVRDILAKLQRRGGPVDETVESVIDEYVANPLRSRPRTARYEKLAKTRLDEFVKLARLRSLDDLETVLWGKYISRLTAQGDSPSTQAHKLALVKSFTKYLHRTERIRRDPFCFMVVKRPGPDDERRALTPEEVATIMAAAPVRPVVAWRKSFKGASERKLEQVHNDGLRRQLVYAIAWATAMRANEIRTLAWRQLDLVRGEIRYTARDEKKVRRAETVYLAPWLVARLVEWRDQHRADALDPDGRVIHVETHIAGRHLIRDAEFAADADLLDLDPTLGKVDLHALGRTSLSTWLTDVDGIETVLADLFTRHRPQGSQRVRSYVKRRPERMHEIAARIPDVFELMEMSPGTQAGRSTGEPDQSTGESERTRRQHGNA